MNTLRLIKQLVSIPSYVDKDCNEKAVADFLVSYIENNLPWLKIVKQKVSGDRYNILALPNDNSQLLFISHMDTVLPQKNKLKYEEKKDKLSGLGAVDMKSGLAVSIKAVEKYGRGRSVGLIFDCDEEYYFVGAKKIVSGYQMKPQLIVFPEPTDGNIVYGCKGLLELEFEILGKSVHASIPSRGINAIEKSVELIVLLKKAINENSKKESTVNLGGITGGIKVGDKIICRPNMVPNIARVRLDNRIADLCVTEDFILNKITKIGNQIGVDVKNMVVKISYKGYECSKENFKWLQNICKRNNLSGKMEYENAFNESAIFGDAWQCPCINLGPGPSDKAHNKNEYVDLSYLDKLEIVYGEIINKLTKI